MDLRDLKTFLHLAESRHFGRSARAMHVSPSTLSRQIQRLEEDLGQPLFVRDNRTVTLTEAGEELRVFAQQTLLQYQQLRHTLDQQGPSLSGELHIFCSVTAAYSHLPPILDRFRAEHPSVEIKLTTGDAADAIDSWLDHGAEPALQAAFAERASKQAQADAIYGERHTSTLSNLSLHELALRHAGCSEVATIWQRFENRILMGIKGGLLPAAE